VSATPVAALRVWRVPVFQRVIGSVVAALPSLIAVAAWVTVVIRRSADDVVPALVVTATAAVFWTFVWWTALRPRLVLTENQVIVINPWGTQRVPLSDVAGVTAGRLLLRSGFSVPSLAIAGIAAGRANPARLARDVAAAVEQVRAGRRS
jgi:hypothetical protein